MPLPISCTIRGRLRPRVEDEKFRPRLVKPKQRIIDMLKTQMSFADEKRAAAQAKDNQAVKEREKARRERAEHGAKLRSLRLAKEAADKEAAAEKAAAKSKKKPSRSTQAP